MENENEQIQSTETQEDSIMPVGWDGEMDFFEWASTEPVADEQEVTEEQTEEESGTEESEEIPTTDSDAEENVESETEEGEEPTTQTEPEPQSTKIRFDANINHKVQSVEIDQSELPNLYQKAYAADKFRNKLNAKTAELEQAEVVAKILGYDTVKAMLDAAKKSYEDTEIERLTSEKVHPDIAKDTVSRRVREIEEGVNKSRKQAQEEKAEATEETPQQAEPGKRDFVPEVAELLEVYPELRGKKLPKEVVEAAIKGQRVITAYTKYRNKQDKADKAKLKKENETLKQNAESARRAPVRGVAKGGATNVGADDPFLQGFKSFSSY